MYSCVMTCSNSSKPTARIAAQLLCVSFFNLSLPLASTQASIDATHIFDGLNDFPTHVAHMRLGSFVTQPTPWPFTPPTTSPSCVFSPPLMLYSLALQWLKEDREHRRRLEKEGQKSRGAKRDQVFILPFHLHLIYVYMQVIPSDSEAFYKKCTIFFHLIIFLIGN
jgi:hypothetical protein